VIYVKFVHQGVLVSAGSGYLLYRFSSFGRFLYNV